MVSVQQKTLIAMPVVQT